MVAFSLGSPARRGAGHSGSLHSLAPWLLEYLAEMTSFPRAKHSDQVDSTSQALAWIKTAMYGGGMGLSYYMKEQAQLARGGRPSP